MNKRVKSILKRIGSAAIAGLLPLSAVADSGGDNWSISGWLNEGLTYIDDGVGSDVVQLTDNGNTLGSRITLNGSMDLPNTGLSAGFEVILEPHSGALGLGSGGYGNISAYDSDNGDVLGVLSNNINLSGAFGKLTLGLQSMPTDNIAVLEDPSLTLWSSIGPVFRGNGVIMRGGKKSKGNNSIGSTYGDFLNCYTNPALRNGLGIGMDCNGTYLRGIRYDLPAIGPLTIAVGYANDDVFDVAAKYKGEFGGLKGQLAIGYASNSSGYKEKFNIPVKGVPAALKDTIDNINQRPPMLVYKSAKNLQLQAGLMHMDTGVFGTVAYQREDASLTREATVLGLDDKPTAYWLKTGVKRAFNSLGDTSIAFQFGRYNDQFGLNEALVGVRSSKLKRIGFEINQYFGSRFILYGTYENLSVDVKGNGNNETCTEGGEAAVNFCSVAIADMNGSKDLDTFTAGMVYFF